MAYVPVSRTIAKRFGGEANLRMAVSKAVSGRLAPCTLRCLCSDSLHSDSVSSNCLLLVLRFTLRSDAFSVVTLKLCNQLNLENKSQNVS